MASDTDVARVIIEVNTKKAESDIERLEKKAEKLREEFSKALAEGDAEGAKKLERSLKSTATRLDNLRIKAGNLRTAMKDLSSQTPKELQRTIRMITAELTSGKIARGSKEWDSYIAVLKKAKAELKKVQTEMQVTTGKATKLRDIINNWGASLAAGAAAFAGIVMSGKAAVQAYADMEQEEANVRKFTGMTAEQVTKLNDEFKKMDTRTSREELNKLAQEAGRLGKTSQEDVLGFVRAADKINVALDDLGDGATLTLSKLTGIFGDEKIYGTEKSLLKVGSVINELSQNCSASAPYLAEFASRMGGVAAQAGMSIQQVMAFGAVLDTNNQKVEASATAVSQVLVRLYQDPAKYAKVAGLDVKKFSDLMKKDANEALLLFLSTLQKSGGMDVLSPMFKDMGETGSRAISALSTLASNIAAVKWQQEEANKAYEEGTSVGKEFDVQNNTVQAGLDKARKGFNEMAIALGKELLPVMRYCISGTSMLMRTMLTLVNFFKEYKTIILSLTAAVIGYTAAVKWQIIQTKAVTTWTKAAALAQRAWNAAIKANPMGLLVAGIAAAITAIATYTKKVKEIKTNYEGLAKVRHEAVKKMEEERFKIEALVAVAKDEKIAMDKRLEAVKRLNAIVPEYNAQIDETTGKYEASEKALDKYLKKLQRRYELEGAKELLADLGRQKAELMPYINQNQNIAEGAARNLQNTEENAGNPSSAAAQLYAAATQSAEGYRKKLAEIEAQERTIMNLYKGELLDEPEPENNGGGGGGGGGGTEESEEELKKRQKEAEKAAKAEAKAFKTAMLLALSEAAVARDMELAENTAAYASGLKDYRQYVEDKHDIEMRGIAAEKKVYEDRGKVGEKAYGKLLAKEQDMLYKHLQTKKKMEADDLKRTYDEEKDRQTMRYFDPSSVMYQNEQAYKQKIFELDIAYLEKKKQLYTEGSKEWSEIELEIQQKLNDDKLQKQKDLAAAYEQFAKQYENASGSQREQNEIAMMKGLYDAKLITEEEYQKAVADIKEKYLQEDRDRQYKWHDEVGDMVVNLRDTFTKLFENFDGDWREKMRNIADATSAAFALMSAVAQSYSNYVNAERDAELAKVEARYDKEIAAAGNNTKKKEKLEKQKEKETAKIKNQYAKKSQKVEIAMALAQTAMSAISAYTAALQVGGLAGLILAPIAAALATAFGMMQVATIKKQHQAESAGYYSGGFTRRDPDNRREVGVVHANEFVANHEAVANPAVAPVLRLLDYAQRNNTVGSLTAADVSNALGQGAGVSARGVVTSPAVSSAAAPADNSAIAGVLSGARDAIDALNSNIARGIEATMIMDGERGFDAKYTRYNRLRNNPHR